MAATGPDNRPVSRSTKQWAAAFAAMLALGGLLALAAERGHRSSASDWVELQAGRYGTMPWRLLAREQGHTLCLALASPGTGNPSSAAAAASAGGCGFNADHPSAGFYASGPGPGGVVSSFGPLPARATRIRVARNQTIPTFVLPSGHGLPAGRYWVFIPPTFWPNAATGPATNPQPQDDQGNPVGFTRF